MPTGRKRGGCSARRLGCSVLAACALLADVRARGDESAVPLPAVIQLDAPNPTRDKPHSKLWLPQATGWAWRPTGQGRGVWGRTALGWQPQQHLQAALAGLPGRADVWAQHDRVRAVLVEGARLAVVELRFNAARDRYELS